MNSKLPDRGDADSQLEQILADYLHAAEAGEPMDERVLIACHPDLADELQSFFTNRRIIGQLAAPIQQAAADSPTLGTDGRVATESQVVRYFGDYELLNEIARGGMGVVYRARQVSLNRHVAIKMILSGQLASQVDIHRFRAEAEAAANLDHPHIVPIYEIGEHEGQHYFSMKLISGCSLAQAIAAQPGGISPRDAARIVSAAARAVHHAHQRGVLHRDLKPGNILLAPAIDNDSLMSSMPPSNADGIGIAPAAQHLLSHGAPHISDFGLAKRTATADETTGGITHSGAIVGTPSYMAPEQARSEKQLSTAVDVYALGVILFELLVGRPPLRGDDPLSTLKKVIECDPPSLRSVKPQLDRDLETIYLKCLEKQPGRRYDSAAALADDLDSWARGEPIKARPIRTRERLVKWARRRPIAAAFAAFLAASTCSFVAVLIGAYYRIEQESSARLVALSSAQKAQALAERRQYGAQILLAQSASEQVQIGQAVRALTNTTPELRGWEWHYLQTVSDASTQTIELQETFNKLRFAPDNQTVIGIGSDLTPRWQSLVHPNQHGKKNINQRYLVSHGEATNVEWSDDLRWCVISQDRGLTIWDRTTDRSIELVSKMNEQDDTSPDHEEAAVAISAHGERAYRADSNRIECWDVVSRTRLWHLQSDGVAHRMVLSPNESRLAVSLDDGTVSVIDIEGQAEILRTPAQNNAPYFLAFTMDEQRLITASAWDTPGLWNIANTSQLVRFKTLGWITTLSPDRKLAATALADGNVQLWNTDTGEAIRVLQSPNKATLEVCAFSPDGNQLSAGGRDKVVKVWDVPSGRLLRKLVGHRHSVAALAFSSDGHTMASAAHDRTLKIWDLRAAENPLSFAFPEGEIRNWSLLPTSHQTVVGGWTRHDEDRSGVAFLLDFDSGTVVREFGPHSGWVEAIAISNAGSLLATGGDDSTVKLWNVSDGSLRTTLGHSTTAPMTDRPWDEHLVNVLAITSDDTYVISGGNDGSLAAWDISAQQLIWKTRTGTDQDSKEIEVRHLVIGPDGKQAITISTQSLELIFQIWDIPSGRAVATVSSSLHSVRAPFAASDNAKYCVYGGSSHWGNAKGSKNVILWDVMSGVERRRVGPYDDVDSLALSPTGDWLAVGYSQDAPASAAIDCIETATGRILWTAEGHEGLVSSLSFLPDGSRLVSSSWDHTVKMWDVQCGQELLSLPLSSSPEERAEHVLVAPDGTSILATNGNFPQPGGSDSRNLLMRWQLPRPK